MCNQNDGSLCTLCHMGDSASYKFIVNQRVQSVENFVTWTNGSRKSSLGWWVTAFNIESLTMIQTDFQKWKSIIVSSLNITDNNFFTEAGYKYQHVLCRDGLSFSIKQQHSNIPTASLHAPPPHPFRSLFLLTVLRIPVKGSFMHSTVGVAWSWNTWKLQLFDCWKASSNDPIY